MNGHDGFLLVNKPRGMTSFDVIRPMRRIFSGAKIGHAGTLDPDASGLLIIAVGNATRFLSYLITEPKVYRFIVWFGRETDTLDATGTVTHDGGLLPSIEAVKSVLPKFEGVQQQVPPAYSAVKLNGRRAYELARKGVIPELKAREITVYSLQMLEYDHDKGAARLEAACSGGTYVRSLARDIARKLGTYGHASDIHRLRCGVFSEENSAAPGTITEDSPLIPVQTALSHYPVREVTPEQSDAIFCGRDIILSDEDTSSSDLFVMTRSNVVIALVRRTPENRFHPSIVCSTVEKDEK